MKIIILQLRTKVEFVYNKEFAETFLTTNAFKYHNKTIPFIAYIGSFLFISSMTRLKLSLELKLRNAENRLNCIINK